MGTISDVLMEQYGRAWDMARELIGGFGADEWRSGHSPGLVPARWALHALDAADFYSRSEVEGFASEVRHIDWAGPADAIPDQQWALQYLGRVAGRAREWMATVSDDAWLGPTPFHWTGRTMLDTGCYNLRHLLYHLGEVSMLLRQAGAEETAWR
ncbi:MAG TPA: DinB family protein [Armatimonadota bacterium]|nr:DinB family protein [Armatimonadota bacterium]